MPAGIKERQNVTQIDSVNIWVVFLGPPKVQKYRYKYRIDIDIDIYIYIAFRPIYLSIHLSICLSVYE